MKNKTNEEKTGAANTGLNVDLSQNLIDNNEYTTGGVMPQYICSFCFNKVTNNLCLINRIGACSRCTILALEFAEAWENELKTTQFKHFADKTFLDCWGEL